MGIQYRNLGYTSEGLADKELIQYRFLGNSYIDAHLEIQL